MPHVLLVRNVGRERSDPGPMADKSSAAAASGIFPRHERAFEPSLRNPEAMALPIPMLPPVMTLTLSLGALVGSRPAHPPIPKAHLRHLVRVQQIVRIEKDRLPHRP